MDKDRLLHIVDSADAFIYKKNFVDAFKEYEKAYPLIYSELIKDKRSKSIGNMVGWTAGFMTGGIGIEDLFVIPAVSRGVAGLMGVDDGFANQLISSLVLRQIDCLLHNDELARSIPKENIYQKFAMLYSAVAETSMMEKVLSYYMPDAAKATPFDDSEVLQSSLTYITYAIDTHPTEWNDYHFLLYSYLGKIGDRSDLFDKLSEIFGESSESAHNFDHEASSPFSSKIKDEYDYYQDLGIQPGAKKDEIRKAYLDLLKKYHPDKFASLSDEFQELAKRRTQEIIEAYEYLNNLK